MLNTGQEWSLRRFTPTSRQWNALYSSFWHCVITVFNLTYLETSSKHPGITYYTFPKESLLTLFIALWTPRWAACGMKCTSPTVKFMPATSLGTMSLQNSEPWPSTDWFTNKKTFFLLICYNLVQCFISQTTALQWPIYKCFFSSRKQEVFNRRM